jgi:hypothetical protein
MNFENVDPTNLSLVRVRRDRAMDEHQPGAAWCVCVASRHAKGVKDDLRCHPPACVMNARVRG